jgi:hypothetical protein
MAGGTVRPSTNPTGLQRYPDLGRTVPNLSATQTRFNRSVKDINPDAREKLVIGSPAPIGPLTQSPGLPRVGNIVEKDIMDPSGSEVIGRQLTAEGYPITYPRMASRKAVPFYPGKREMEKGDLRKAQMVRNIPTRQTWKLSPDYPLKLNDPQTGEQQTLYMGGGPLKRYTI